jgi:2-polyprenyl-6-methoxyphenol hydroxylase-like FAD-dependent oxidoreductase
MRAVIVGAGMGGLMTALALRQFGVFASVDVYEQTKVPSTAGAGLHALLLRVQALAPPIKTLVLSGH